MTRSHRRYQVELRIRDNDGGTAYGTVLRFLYTDEEGQDWVRVNEDWYPVDDRYDDPHAFVQELPRDLLMEAA